MYILTGGGIFQVEAIPTQITTGLKATTVSVSIESVSLQLKRFKSEFYKFIGVFINEDNFYLPYLFIFFL